MNFIFFLQRAVFILFIVLPFSGCVTGKKIVKGGKEYCIIQEAFRGKYWEYFLRGLSCMEGGFYEEAIHDFEEAIKKRNDDQWRARTYGMHFIDYFPNREMGIAFYRLKQYEDAIKLLEKSLNTVESAKTKYFLNQTRKAIINEKKSDKLPPVLTIHAPLDNSVTNQLTLTVSGVAEDENFVSRVLINNAPILLELSGESVPFETIVHLKKGSNEIKIEAEDLTGKAAETSLKVYVDRDGPLITIEDYHIVNRQVVISGFISDDSEIKRFAINGKETHAALSKEIAFEEEVDMSQGNVMILIEAEDIAGNSTRAELDVSSNTSSIPVWPMVASLEDGRLYIVSPRKFADSKFAEQTREASPPVIKIKELTDGIEVYKEEILIEGKVSDNTKVTQLSINDEPIFIRQGKIAYFSTLRELSVGENKFIIRALDSDGLTGEKVINIIRKEHQIKQLSMRMSIANFPMKIFTQNDMFQVYVHDILIESFIEQKRFKLIERKEIDKVLRELKLSQTELVDPGAALETGNMLGVEGIITGTIYETEDYLEIVARLIDTQTGEIMSSNDVFCEGKGLRVIRERVEELAYKFKIDFPLLEGLITDFKENTIIFALGLKNKLKESMGIIIFREIPQKKDFKKEKKLGPEFTIIGQGRIKVVYDEFSEAIIVETESEPVPLKDKVITK